ncbi:sensor domain-containing diguanylate cyclase [Desulfotalea psychrophila]|uniref:diguanylate cyclase n=1 Tax=Desulfotalea psychrophila (strain LSv54 / DSM 12343) TaxID=177439 RepID=Q6AL41_DESPS|nr:GGDEF domain-containing protein [Desulfotalea psychrophila]CAG36934.1 hypothetical protein DP2205 [Desulfotalea psychrophila LSv54]
MQKADIIRQALHSRELPTLPVVASQILTLTAAEDVTLTSIAQLVSQDISLSAKMLKVVNSAHYGFPQDISSINQAVSLLGLNAVRCLVLSFSFLSMKVEQKANLFDFKSFWQRSLASTVTAKLILDNIENANSEEVLITGLLQNLGELIFAVVFPDKYEEILENSEEITADKGTTERAILSVTHCRMGYEIAKAWALPPSIYVPILYHHSPKSYTGGSADVQRTISAIYLSDILTQIFFSRTPEIYYNKFRKEARSLLMLKEEDIQNILANVHTEIKKAGSTFDIEIKKIRSIQDILQEANIRLSLLNLNYDQVNRKLVETTIELEKLTEELAKKNRQLETLANIDGLTNCYNHRYFQNALDQELSRSSRNSLAISLIMFDIDNFKRFNDSYGHQAGDFILCELTRLIQEQIRKDDVLARYGGEEFVIILPETEKEDALIVAEKVRHACEEHSFQNIHKTHQITISLGVATEHSAQISPLNKTSFIDKTDLALYSAKENGRNKVVVYSPKKRKWFL